MSATTTATPTTIITGVKHDVNSSSVPAVPSAACENASRSSSCGGESEILRSRLLCSSRNTTSSSCVISGAPLETQSSVIKMSQSSGGPGGSGSTAYPKCNISVTMNGASEQLTVITTSLASSNPVGVYPALPMIIPKVESEVPEVEIKPLNIFHVGQQGTSSVPVGPSYVPVTTIGSPMSSLMPTAVTGGSTVAKGLPVKQEPVLLPTSFDKITGIAPLPAPTVKQESPVLSISYDRDRILTFLTDYWKSKNLQQVTEAQQQTAGISGVATSDFCPAPQRIVEEALFDLFIEHPMMIDGLPISKRAWAKAFYEKDIIQTSKVLFEALFSEQEMQQCTLNGKKGTPELSAVKMLAVLRAAAWMKEKKQDPYSFNTNIPEMNQFPTTEEREKIEKKVFTERRSQANRKITKTTGTGDGSSPPPASNEQTSNWEGHNQPPTQNQGSPVPPKTTSPTPPTTSTSSSSAASIPAPAGENRLSLSEDLRREHMAPLAKIPRLDLDTEIVKQLQMLYAENPEGLISYLLPGARTILIDGFLIPHEDWMKAFNEANTDIVKSAWTLFKVFFSKTEILNCTLNGKNGTKELCPVKKLAILRAVTWMKDSQGTSIDAFTFNVRTPGMNSFPSDEDKDKIETKVYTEKRYQACRKLKGQQI